ncbi:MAG: glycosyltransferase family 2 protein [Thiobacillaceae bacterium]
MDHFNPDLISVIMPCYNAASFVGEAVASALGQTYVGIELIVVDDGSTDGSVEILEKLAADHPGKMKLLFQNRLGPYPARNVGLSHATGGKVAFLDADDLWREDCLQKLSSALDESRSDVAYCGWQNFGEGAPGTEAYIPPDYLAMDTTAEFLRSCPWPIHAALVRRPVLDAVRGFSERRFSSMDYDLWLRIYARTQKLVRVPEVMAFYRWHEKGQISRDKWRQVMDALQVRHDFVAHHPERVTHLLADTIHELTEGFILKEAYRAYWMRDLPNAQALFRRAFTRGAWRMADLKYILPSWLPGSLFLTLVKSVDRKRQVT